MNAINVVKPLQDPVISKDIKEHILERNLINVIKVVKPLQDPVISSIIKEHAPDRKLNVISVVKCFHQG